MVNEGDDTAADDQRQIEVMKHLRRVHMKRLVKNPPPGFRVSDDGESVVPDGDRDWPSKLTSSPFLDPSGMLGFLTLASPERVGFRWAESSTRKSRLHLR
jgi:hypothetical protein